MRRGPKDALMVHHANPIHPIRGLSLALMLSAAPALADNHGGATVILDQAKLPWASVHNEGFAAPLAIRADTPPPLAIVRIPAGAQLEPHTGGPKLRFVTVISGVLSYADGDSGDPALLKDYPAGTVLMLPPDTMHYAAARNGDVLLMATLVDPAELTDAVKAQLTAQ
jgi:hypothetical protein